MKIQCMVGTSLRIRNGFGKETMQRKESIRNRCGWKCTCKAAVLAAMIMIVVCSGCTRKEELTFSLQNMQPDGTEAEEKSGSEPQAGAVSAEAEEISESIASSGDDQAVALSDTAAVTESAAGASLQREICVHVCGAVEKPGVYTLPFGSRVYEAVQAAGGFTEDADENYVNQAQQLPDAVQLVIPTSEQTVQAEESGLAGGQTNDAGGNDENVYCETERIGIISQDDPVQSGVQDSMGDRRESSDDGKININTASVQQLCDIPGIGAVRASAIASYRQEHGAFQTIEDIMKVSGIKQGTYDKIKDSIKVN